jgi:dsRNA-specific ribonuclease
VQHQYRLTDESGPAHKKTFSVCLKIGDKEEFMASGPSIKKGTRNLTSVENLLNPLGLSFSCTPTIA